MQFKMFHFAKIAGRITRFALYPYTISTVTLLCLLFITIHVLF